MAISLDQKREDAKRLYQVANTIYKILITVNWIYGIGGFTLGTILLVVADSAASGREIEVVIYGLGFYIATVIGCVGLYVGAVLSTHSITVLAGIGDSLATLSELGLTSSNSPRKLTHDRHSDDSIDHEDPHSLSEPKINLSDLQIVLSEEQSEAIISKYCHKDIPAYAPIETKIRNTHHLPNLEYRDCYYCKFFKTKTFSLDNAFNRGDCTQNNRKTGSLDTCDLFIYCKD